MSLVIKTDPKDEQPEDRNHERAEASLKRAREAFRDLKDGAGIPAVLYDTIKVALRQAGKGPAALYSDDAVEAEIRTLLIGRLQKFVTMLEQGQGNPTALVSSIRTDLKHLGEDASVLDPSGKKSADQMNAYIAELAKRNKTATEVAAEMNASLVEPIEANREAARHIASLVTEAVVADISPRKLGPNEKHDPNLIVEEWFLLKEALDQLAQKQPGNTKTGLAEGVAALVHKEVRNEVLAGRLNAEKWNQLPAEKKARYEEKGLDTMIMESYRDKNWRISVGGNGGTISR